MDLGYIWTLRQGENCCQFRFLTWASLIDQYEMMGCGEVRDRHVSQHQGLPN